MIVLLFPLLTVAQEKQEKDEEKPTFPLDNFYAERKPWARVIFKNFRFGLSTGYGNTFFRHSLDKYGIFQPAGNSPRVFPMSSQGSHYINWVNQITPDSLVSGPDSYFISSDTAKLGFKGNAWSIPFKASIHYEFLQKFRIGGGYSYEFMSIGSMRPTSYHDKISSFRPGQPSGWMRRYWGMGGVSFYRLQDYLFTADLNIGSYKPGKNFALAAIQKGLYYNLGVTIERDFSEYLRAFIRPSFEIKSYTLALPEPIKHHINAFYINIGFTYSLPELPKCYNKDCNAQINHAHGDREYRSRVHKVYKKQNPQYGENYPRLLKYKGRNKKKLNPY